MASGFTNQGAYKPCTLLAGEFPRVKRIITIAKGAVLPKGALLGQITESQKWTLSTAAATDGSQIPEAVLGEKIDAREQDREAAVYFTGEFNEYALVPGEGHHLDRLRSELRPKGIFLRRNLP